MSRPLFNAGKGSVFTSAGPNELDAPIMDGKTRNAGAVAGVKRIKNPISLARLVMEKSPHVMMAREGRSREKDTYVDGFFNTPWLDIQHGDFMRTAYIDKEKFEALKDRYYELGGWDAKTGWPMRAKLEELDMKDVADALEMENKLPASET